MTVPILEVWLLAIKQTYSYFLASKHHRTSTRVSKGTPETQNASPKSSWRGTKIRKLGGQHLLFVSRENKRSDLVNKFVDVYVSNALKLTYKHL